MLGQEVPVGKYMYFISEFMITLGGTSVVFVGQWVSQSRLSGGVLRQAMGCFAVYLEE